MTALPSIPSATVIVIGGGVVGLSTAYHLISRRIGRVVVVEKGRLGEGSSSRAAGIITGLLWSETGVAVRKKSLELFRDFSRDLPGYRFRDVGCLNLLDPDAWASRRTLLRLYERFKMRFELLNGSEIERRWPQLRIPEDVFGLFDPDGGYSEPDEYIPALAARCRALGVEIREGKRVTGLVVEKGRVCGIESETGPLRADAVVCTVHAWTLMLLESAGVSLPIKHFVHQRYLTQPFAQTVRIPAVNANFLGGYVRSAAGNRVLAGRETAQRPEFRVTSPEFQMSELTAPQEVQSGILRDYPQLLPTLQNGRLESERVGLISYSMDGEPVLGPVAGLPGLHVAAAFHSGGFAYGPAAGLLLADYVVDGRPRLSLEAFSPNRFEAEAAARFQGRTLRQGEVARRRH